MPLSSADLWFSSWNYHLLRVLFTWIPHSPATDDFCGSLILNPLLSTAIFAFCFYWFWTRNDEHTEDRRRYLLIAVFALAIAVLVTIVLRPWVHWPAPVLSADFQRLFPRYLWGDGVRNCFPSHSTLVYFTVAAGFWPLHRRLSLWLAVFALLFISFPRVYEGGHYPIDVLFSCVLGTSLLVVLWRWPFLVGLSSQSSLPKSLGSGPAQLIFFLWVLELGEGFRGAELIATTLQKTFLR